MILQDGTGTGKTLGINGRNEATTFSISESEAQYAAETGKAYNINTDEVTFAASTDSALLYFETDENTDYVVEAIAVGFRNSTTTDDLLALYIERNPTGGTLYDAATDVGMNGNRNFGSSDSLKSTTLSYKSTAQNQTLTGGSNILLVYVSKAARGFIPINLEMPRGSSIGVRVASASLATTCYAAIVGHIKDDVR
jgi:hypothetical protein